MTPPACRSLVVMPLRWRAEAALLDHLREDADDAEVTLKSARWQDAGGNTAKTLVATHDGDMVAASVFETPARRKLAYGVVKLDLGTDHAAVRGAPSAANPLDAAPANPLAR